MGNKGGLDINNVFPQQISLENLPAFTLKLIELCIVLLEEILSLENVVKQSRSHDTDEIKTHESEKNLDANTDIESSLARKRFDRLESLTKFLNMKVAFSSFDMLLMNVLNNIFVHLEIKQLKKLYQSNNEKMRKCIIKHLSPFISKDSSVLIWHTIEELLEDYWRSAGFTKREILWNYK